MIKTLVIYIPLFWLVDRYPHNGYHKACMASIIPYSRSSTQLVAAQLSCDHSPRPVQPWRLMEQPLLSSAVRRDLGAVKKHNVFFSTPWVEENSNRPLEHTWKISPTYTYDSGFPNHKQLVEGLCFPGVCWSFLGMTGPAWKKGRFPNDVRSLEATNTSFCQMIALGFDVIEPP